MEGLTYDKSIIRLPRQIFIVNAKCVKTVQIAAVEMVFTPFLLRFNYILYCGMVSVGAKEAPEAELALNGCTAYVRQLYQDTAPFNGGRWMMIEVRNGEVLEDVKELIGIRMRKKRSV